MNRPRLLDLFCKAGGASVGYHRAGFEVIGVDIAPQPNYPYRFIQADAIDLLTSWVGGGHWFHELPTVAAWHASPPCQRYSSMTRVRGNPADHPDLVSPTRALLMATGLPYAIENVEGAPLQDAITLCGSMFGLGVRRHRQFEVHDVDLLVAPCDHSRRAVPVYGNAGGSSRRDGIKFPTTAERMAAMGIDWMTGAELSQAIPPAYTEFIGRRLMAAIGGHE